MMHKVALGATGMTVSAVGLGCSRLGSTLGGCTGAAADRLLRHAQAVGVSLFDTADIYGQGDSERLLGAALRGNRDRAVILTKAGQRFTAAQRAVALAKGPLRLAARHLPQLRRRIAARRAAPLPRDFRPDYLREAIRRSLRRLRTDRIDLFLLHSPPAEELRHAHSACEMLDRLVQAGDVRAWGVSCDDAEALQAALAIPSVAVVQLPLALARTEAGRRMLDAAAARGVGVLVRELGASVVGGLADPSARRQAVAAALATAAAAVVGTTNAAHLDEIVAEASRIPLRMGMTA